MGTERIEAAGLNLEERIIDIWRCAAVVKGGRRFSFAAMVVVGNGSGVAGLGYGKAREVPVAIEKAVKDARKNLVRVSLYGTTVPHEVRGRYATAAVQLIPALPGTGVIAGQVSRSILECVGVRDILSKSVGGNNNPKNLARATLEALLALRGREEISRLRGVALPEDPVLARSLQAATAPRKREWADRPQRGERGGEGGGSRGRRGRRGPEAAADAPAAPAAAETAAIPAAAEAPVPPAAPVAPVAPAAPTPPEGESGKQTGSTP